MKKLLALLLTGCMMATALVGCGAKEEAPAEPEAPPAPSNEEVLLAEIRDLLKNKN